MIYEQKTPQGHETGGSGGTLFIQNYQLRKISPMRKGYSNLPAIEEVDLIRFQRQVKIWLARKRTLKLVRLLSRMKSNFLGVYKGFLIR